jgi:hypothetical protein
MPGVPVETPGADEYVGAGVAQGYAMCYNVFVKYLLIILVVIMLLLAICASQRTFVVNSPYPAPPPTSFDQR